MISKYFALVSICLIIITNSTYTKRHSPLVDNGVYFFKRLALKLDVNPMFYYQYKNFQNFVCSSKMGPKCSFINPLNDFARDFERDKEQAQLHNRLREIVKIHTPYLEKLVAQDSKMLFLASDQMKKYDKLLEPLYQ